MSIFSLHLDAISLILGFILATILWWAVRAARPAVAQLRESLKSRAQRVRASTSSGIEERYRRGALSQAQTMHVAAPLFPLGALIEPPRLLAPPGRVEPGQPPHTEEIVSETIPYTPAWPELASAYGAPTLSLQEALSGGTNIAVIGQPGSGKTVSLAYLAMQVINRAPEAPALHGSVPFLVHIADIDLHPEDPGDPLSSIVEEIADHVSVLDLPRAAGFVRKTFESGRALLLLDGLDELAPGPLREAGDFVRAILKTFPQTRIVCTGAPENIDGLIALGFVPLALATWGEAAQERVLRRWSNLWQQQVVTDEASSGNRPVDPGLLNAWLAADNESLTPLEYTLKIWGAYAGDTRGADALSAVETQVRRLTPSNVLPQALGDLAMQAGIHASAIFDGRTARSWVKTYDVGEEAGAGVSAEPMPDGSAGIGDGEDNVPHPDERDTRNRRIHVPRPSLLGKLATAGLLVAHRGDRHRFSHPVYGGYLAGKAVSAHGAARSFTQQAGWAGRSLVLRYYAAVADASGAYERITDRPDPLLERGLMTAARWLRDSDRQAPWRSKLMPRLADILQEGATLSLRVQALTALALSGDPSVAELFHQLIHSPSDEVRQLGALGCGMTRDTRSVEWLRDLLKDHAVPVRRAAGLALVRIGERSGLVALAALLQQGDEESRRAAAEALANDPGEGWDTLREGATSQDILLRRAAIFGLARVDAPWALETLEKIQVEDEQWVVRTLAAEYVQARQNPEARIPHKLTAPADTPWIIEFAGRYGMGVTPGQPVTDLLLLALKSDKDEERQAALSYLRYIPGEGVLAALFGCIYGSDLSLREGAYYLLWEMSITGAKIPDPQQFGLG